MTTDEVDRTLELGEKAASDLRDGYELALAETRQRPSRGEIRKTIAVAVMVGTLLGCILSILVSLSASRDVAVVAADQRLASVKLLENQQLAQDAYEQAQLANEALKRRGQRPVAVPDPRTSTAADVIAGAAVPIVLAELDEAGVSADGIAARVAAYMRANPVQVSTERLAQLIADYLRENPPPAGPQGRTGAPGTPGTVITSQDIVDAVNVVCGQQPGGSCEGATGAKGDTGNTGPAGRGISNTDLRDTDPAPIARECVLVIEYTDGTKEEEAADDSVCEDFAG